MDVANLVGALVRSTETKSLLAPEDGLVGDLSTGRPFTCTVGKEAEIHAVLVPSVSVLGHLGGDG